MRNFVITLLATILVPGVAVVVVPYWILQATGGQSASPPGLVEAAAVILALVGAAMVVWVSVTFVAKGHGTPVPLEPPKDFVAVGLYRFLRNPMYVGALLVLFAESILFRSAWILLYAGMLWLALHAFTVVIEEPQLERRFGDPYRQYRSRTPRWVPRKPKA